MDSIIHTGCKINLFLRIGGRRSDGYHLLDTVFIPLQVPCDTLRISTSPALSPALNVSFSVTDIDCANNTLTKTFDLYTKKCPLPLNISVSLEKNIPHGAGLGGGSANAAGFLLFLQKMAIHSGIAPLKKEDLYSLATRVGADVPFFLMNCPALASGIGEKLTPCRHPYEGYTLLLVCPDIAVSTPMAFKALDNFRKKNKKASLSSLTSFQCQVNSFFFDDFCPQNDFEVVVFQEYPKLAKIKNQLLQTGAIVALMSGTGSSIFGIYTNSKDAKKARQCIHEKTFLQKLSSHVGV